MTQEVRLKPHYNLVKSIDWLLCSVDCGDYVVVTNARTVHVSGNKHDQKVYYSHTMYPGGLKERRYKDLIKKNPDAVRCNTLSYFYRH